MKLFLLALLCMLTITLSLVPLYRAEYEELYPLSMLGFFFGGGLGGYVCLQLIAEIFDGKAAKVAKRWK